MKNPENNTFPKKKAGKKELQQKKPEATNCSGLDPGQTKQNFARNTVPLTCTQV